MFNEVLHVPHIDGWMMDGWMIKYLAKCAFFVIKKIKYKMPLCLLPNPLFSPRHAGCILCCYECILSTWQKGGQALIFVLFLNWWTYFTSKNVLTEESIQLCTCVYNVLYQGCTLSDFLAWIWAKWYNNKVVKVVAFF